MALKSTRVVGSRVCGTAVALVMSAVVAMTLQGPDGFVGAAWAEGQGSGQGNQGEGNQGQGDEGQGGPGEESDGQGPQAGGSTGNAGGKPVWAQEGIPEVELGRLNVARSPDKVLDRSLAEALNSLTPEMISYYNLSIADAVEALSLNFDNTTFIDSPLQNLALLRDLLDGTSALTAVGVTNDVGTLAAMVLGAASDKTVPISVETVVAVTAILGTPVTGAAAVTLATEAESIRIAILAGHG